MIITVGAQGEQIIYSIKQLKPKYVGFLATNTKECKAVIDHICKECNISQTSCRCDFVNDDSAEIGALVLKFYDIYNWLKTDGKLNDNEIIIDPTGGRKWMSAGITMIASFLGLELVYVDVKYKDNKPDPETMRIIDIGNAYEQVGFLEEKKGDDFFNKCNFSSARDTYDSLSKKMKNPLKILIKKDIANAYLHWWQFRFNDASTYLQDAIDKIKQYELLNEHREKLEKQMAILSVLKRNDESSVQFFRLLQDDSFVEKMLLTLIAQEERYAENQQYNQAVILLYRILELIAQYSLAKQGINFNDVSKEIRDKFRDKFKDLTKKIFQAESEISTKISLVQSYILLFLLQDAILRDENEKFLKDLRENTNTRNLLWLEHGNKHAKKEEYLNFRKFVLCRMLTRIMKDWKDKLYDYQYIEF